MISTYLVPLDDIAKVRDEHLAFLEGLFAQGTLVAAGRQDPPVGGMVLLDVPDEAAAREVLTRDPYVVHGFAEYEARGWAPTVGALKSYIKS
ncbi:YciI family protein [Actinoplanes sp. KI2]|uniref:YciI family protein n=1 Tax=Actinoplanes sp. KI2 TaxID=2983315 RepID=UPI0021D5FDFA|nr:YciI family protein [Actinoplanes sp. KI2]MCU7728221.1 YciI family protein [Actinoplanes sp. KI2]